MLAVEQPPPLIGQQALSHEFRSMNNPLPLLTICLLTRFGPEHAAPAIDQLLTQANAALRNGHGLRFPSALERYRQRAGCRNRKTGARLGRREPLEQRGRHARVARRLQRSPAQSHRVFTRLGRMSACMPNTRRLTRLRSTPEQRQAHKNAMRNFVLGGAELAGRSRAFCRHSGAPGRAGPEVQRERAGRDRMPSLLRRRFRARLGSRTMSSTLPWPPPGQKARKGFQAHPENAVLPAGDAVCP